MSETSPEMHGNISDANEMLRKRIAELEAQLAAWRERNERADTKVLELHDERIRLRRERDEARALYEKECVLRAKADRRFEDYQEKAGAQAAAMREALTPLTYWEHAENCPDGAPCVCGINKAIKALQADAGKALLERVRRLDMVATFGKKLIGAAEETFEGRWIVPGHLGEYLREAVQGLDEGE